MESYQFLIKNRKVQQKQKCIYLDNRQVLVVLCLLSGQTGQVSQAHLLAQDDQLYLLHLHRNTFTQVLKCAAVKLKYTLKFTE